MKYLTIFPKFERLIQEVISEDVVLQIEISLGWTKVSEDGLVESLGVVPGKTIRETGKWLTNKLELVNPYTED